MTSTPLPKTIETELGTEKLCIHCQEYYPMDEEFFFRKGHTKKDGAQAFCATCKACYDMRYKRRKYKEGVTT
ncbi:hypothetical protein CA950_15390 [Acinetobacter pittii]|uniref:hypothetical protein n=1 Tax=Acinetobacter pittii TaxID=48296 RepID=UPI000C184009|nr:hypothetical protein [Acinetobacter pittii]PIL90751.1 hypothetical protein CA950_15390 [Acinetobacter pittii]